MNEPILPSPEDLPSPEEELTGSAEEALWQCRCCGKRHLLRFEVCWKCGTPRDNTPLPQQWLDEIRADPTDLSRAVRSVPGGLTAWIGVFAVGNFLLCPVMNELDHSQATGMLVAAWIATIGAQSTLHSIWCVLAPVPVGKKTVISVGMGSIWFSAWALGFAASEGFQYAADEILAAMLCLPLLLVGVQMPLWVARLVFNWRIDQQHLKDTDTVIKPLQIRHIIIGTGLVGLALTAARAARPDNASSDAEFLLPLLLGAISCATLSLFTALPTTYGMMRASRPLVGLIVALVLDVFVVITFVVNISLIEGSFPTIEAEDVLIFAAAILGFQIPLTVALLTARAHGYRLFLGRRKTAG